MRSPRAGHRRSAWGWLVEKEWRELTASRSWWLMLLLVGPLVGISFISAVRTYAEASGLGGTSQGVGEAFSPLIGIWGPTFSALEVAAVFLLPFVGIRLVANDRQSGSLKIELQHAMSALARIGAKALVLLAGWFVACAAPLVAVLLWKSYGGVAYPPELATVALGHLLNAGLTIAIAAAAAAVTDHPSTAAIVTLSVTVGTWILNFVAAVQGGVWERIASYTPTAMVAGFQHGLVRLDVTLTAVTLVVAGLALAAIWTRLGVAPRRKLNESLVLGAVGTAVLFASTLTTATWDLSENRANSFAWADEAALREVKAPLRITVHLAPQDPRRFDLDHLVIGKLKRVLPRTAVEYVSATSIGLLEQTSDSYGEIWYELGGRRVMNRQTSAEGVLDTIFELAGVTPKAETEAHIFRGHPLAVPPRGAAAVFYGIWPSLVVAAAVFARRRP